MKAVRGVSFDLSEGETLGVVGESGSGKSSLAKAIVRLVHPSGGSVRFDGTDLGSLRGHELRQVRSQLQMVFQDTSNSLDPRLTVSEAVREPLEIHGWDGRSAEERVREVLSEVGMPASHANLMPGELSGGQRQRVVIARALALRPSVLILDEPVSALDLSVQAQILNLLTELRDEYSLSYLFIAHDLSVVGHIADRVAVMYLGNIVELSGSDDVFSSPAHPYTAALASSIPVVTNQPAAERIVLVGEIPNPAFPPTGCFFRTRCPIATELCGREVPELHTVAPGSQAACHYPLGTAESLGSRMEAASGNEDEEGSGES